MSSHGHSTPLRREKEPSSCDQSAAITSSGGVSSHVWDAILKNILDMEPAGWDRVTTGWTRLCKRIQQCWIKASLKTRLLPGLFPKNEGVTHCVWLWHGPQGQLEDRFAVPSVKRQITWEVQFWDVFCCKCDIYWHHKFERLEKCQGEMVPEDFMVGTSIFWDWTKLGGVRGEGRMFCFVFTTSLL